VNLSISNYPLKLTKKMKKKEGGVDSIVASFMFSIGYSFIPASLITFLVKERVSMVKH
jgi:ATP-binding cassette, subfamily A (ABC1), member 3